MPMLKPSISPFQRRSAQQISTYNVETGEAPTLARSPFGRVSQTVGVTQLASPPAPYSPESGSMNDPQTSLHESLSKAGRDERGNQRVAQDAKPGTLIAERGPSATTGAARAETPNIEAMLATRQATGHSARRRQPSMQETTIKRSDAAPTNPERGPAAFSVSKAGRSSVAANKGAAAAHVSEGTAESRSPALLSPAKSSRELQPTNNLAAGDPSPAPVRFESPAQHPASPAVQEFTRLSQPRTAGGVHIGTVEVRILPAPALNVRPPQARPAPATVLSRSLTSSLGLSQGQ